MPGALLPLCLLRRSELQTAEAALAASPPLSRLMVVVRMLNAGSLLLSIFMAACIRQSVCSPAARLATFAACDGLPGSSDGPTEALWCMWNDVSTHRNR